MSRVAHPELARRINAAWALLRSLSASEMTRKLSRRYGVSEVQAYRYIRKAREVKGALPIPERKEVFTVKLPVGLIRRLRRAARRSQETLSSLATRALEAFLSRERDG